MPYCDRCGESGVVGTCNGCLKDIIKEMRDVHHKHNNAAQATLNKAELDLYEANKRIAAMEADIAEEAALGDHNLIPSYRFEIEQLEARVKELESDIQVITAPAESTGAVYLKMKQRIAELERDEEMGLTREAQAQSDIERHKKRVAELEEEVNREINRADTWQRRAEADEKRIKELEASQCGDDCMHVNAHDAIKKQLEEAEATISARTIRNSDGVPVNQVAFDYLHQKIEALESLLLLLRYATELLSG